MTRLAAIASALALCAGCFYPADRGRALEARVDRLLADQNQLRQRAEAAEQKLETTVPRIDEKIGEVTRALESLDKASRRSGADIGVQMQKAVEDVAQLRGQVETYLHRISELEAGLKKLSEETEQKLVALGGDDAVQAAEVRRKSQQLKRPDDPTAFFELAAAQAEGGQPAVARELYAEFIKKWPRDPRIPQAHVRLGELHRAEDRCREAIPEYAKVVQEHAKSAAAPAALLHSADCFEKLKMRPEAKLALEELVRSYPKSSAAKEARARLAKLGKSSAKGRR